MVGYAGGNVVAAGLPQTSFRHTIRSFVFALAVAFGTFQYNLDTTIINGFQAMQGFLRVFGVPGKGGKYVIETTFQQLITSLLQVGLIVASLLIGAFSRYFGRRAGFFVASVIGCVALLIQTFVTSKGAPFAKILSKHSYQLQLVVLFAVPVRFMLYSVIYMPESPRWLATHDRHEEALKSLRKIRGSNFSEAELQAELDIIVEAIRFEREVQAGATFLGIFRGTDLRRTLLACGAATLHAASGINFLVGYGTVFFQIAAPGSDAFRNTIILQVCGFIGALSAPVLARYFGRKTILIAGFSLMCMCFTIVGATNEGKLIHSPKDAPAGAALVAFVCLYQFAYNMSCGPLAWAVGAEIPSQRLRSLTFGFAMGVGFVFAWLTTFTTPKYLNELGVRVAWIWMPSCFITLLWLIFFLPETEGRSLDDLDIMFANRVPALKFMHYVIGHTIAVGNVSEKDADSEKDKGTESRDEVAMV
ncbi:hypothetical protein JCM10296v2_006907 [Rhodotorula toruloides]